MAKTLLEKLAAGQKIVDEANLERCREVVAIFERPEVKQMMADLEALSDPEDTGALQRSAGADASALLANVLLPLKTAATVAARMVARMEGSPPADAAIEPGLPGYVPPIAPPA